jgi:hypothetical protein
LLRRSGGLRLTLLVLAVIALAGAVTSRGGAPRAVERSHR